jgi:hypothetical protein
MMGKALKAAFRIELIRNQIWLSELVGITIVAILLVALLSIGAAGVSNELRIRSNTAHIARLKTDKVLLTDRLERRRQQTAIAGALNHFTNGRLPADMVSLLTDLVYRNSRAYGYDPMLVLAVIHVESVFDPFALGQYRSGKYSGALGLMQLKYATAQEVAHDLGIELKSERDLLEPQINIALGVAYLTRLIARFRDVKLGILAYNQGPGTINKNLREKQPLSIRYYEKVLRSYYRLKSAPVRTGRN